MDSGDAHAALVLPGAAGPRADLRGPGAYEVQGVNAVGTDAPAITFAASTAPRFADPGDAAAASGDGDRLVLEPNLDAVRPVPQAAVILPEHAPPADRDAAGRQPSDALYAVDLSAVRSGPPGAPSFEHMQGRDDAAGGAAAGGGRPLDYEVDKLPLTLLSEFRSAPGGPNFDRMRPHEDGDAGGVDGGAADGTRLDLCPEAAREYLRGRGGAAAPDMQHGDGHGDMLRHARGADAELTAWLDYRGAADVSPVRPAAPGAPDLGRLPGRLSSAAAADDNDTLGVGTYNVRHDQVEAEPVEVDFAHGAPVQRLEALARRDMDEGNMLLLDPHPVSGYSRPNAGEPRLQPMTRAAERFEPQRGDPDTGNVLLLRTSQDGVAHARSRPTAPNAPAAVFATTARDKAFLQPHEQVDLIGLRAMEMLSARRRRGIAGPPAVHQRISTAIMQVGTIGGGDLLHIIKEAGPASEVAQHIRRQERVIARMEAADK